MHELSLEDLDEIWEAQAGKHEAIVKNVEDMLACLVRCFSPEQLDRLFDCFKVTIFLSMLNEYFLKSTFTVSCLLCGTSECMSEFALLLRLIGSKQMCDGLGTKKNDELWCKLLAWFTSQDQSAPANFELFFPTLIMVSMSYPDGKLG